MTAYPAQFTDDGGEVRLVGTIDFTASGNQPGSPAAVYWTSEISTGAPSGGGAGWILNAAGSGPWDAVGSVFGSVFGATTSVTTAPLSTYAAMAVVLGFTQVIVNATSTTADGLDVEVKIQVQNETGSQSLELSGGKTIPASPSGGSVTYASTDLSASATTGSDLAYNAGAGHVTTTAGGSFAVVASIAIYFD